MKTRALLLALPLLALAGCRDNAASLAIQGVCVPSSGCSFSGTCEAFVVANPTLDTTATNWMMVFLQVDNELTANADRDSGRVNTHDAIIDEATIEYSGAVTGTRVVGVQATVPAAGSTVVGVLLIPSGLFATPAAGAAPTWPAYASVLANVRLRGAFRDGQRFETAEFPIAVDVTTGAPQTASCAGACPQSGQYPAACP